MKRSFLVIAAGVALALAIATAKTLLFPSGIGESCYATLEEIDIAKQYWALENNQPLGTGVNLSDLHPRYLHKIPRCPRGGTYVMGRVGELPLCSVTNNPWHQRHYLLNYSRQEFVTGKRVRFAGYARKLTSRNCSRWSTSEIC